MGTILDYFKEYGDYTFSEKPLNEVDSLVLCQFSYLKFDGMVPSLEERKEPVSIKYLDGCQDKEKLFADERYRENNTALFKGMLESIRFSTLRMNYYVNRIKTETETQFSAVTFFLEDGSVYVAYRGTDETIIGWKEDLNLAFSEPVAGQLMSVGYLDRAAALFERPFYMGGHSKGGNFAVFAAMNCKKEIQDQIIKIYSHDGPGFRPEIREQGHYERIADRVMKIIPHSSLVGMLLESHAAGYMVVESKSFGLLQHDPYTWLVKEDGFVKVKDVYKRRKFMDETLNEWILSMDEEHIRSFVDTLYEVVSASKAVTLIDFTADWKRNMTAVVNALKELDGETASMIKKIIASLFELTGERAKEEIKEGLQERAEEGRVKLEAGRQRMEKKRLHKEEKKRQKEKARSVKGRNQEREEHKERK